MAKQTAAYGRDWRKVRAVFVAANPLCARCAARGIVAATEDVHHLKPIATHPDLRLDMTNLEPLCGLCHKAETGRERTGRPVRWGCDANGKPLDSSHPWNAS